VKLDWRGAVGIVVSIVLLVWVLHGISFGEVWAQLRAANGWLFLASAVVGTAVFPLRARRWRPILDPVAPHLPFGMLWRATAIGFMVNNVVPARAGELARAYALTRETDKVPFSAALASLAVDRLFDALVVLSLTLLAILAPAFPADTMIAGQPVTRWAMVGVASMGAVMVVLYAIVFFPDRLIRAYGAVARRIWPAADARGQDILRHFAAGLSVLRDPLRFAAILAWAVAHWLANGFAFWLAFRAVGITAPYSAALFLQGLIVLGVAIPSSPGFFGVFEAFAKLGLSVYGVPKELAVSWAIGYHIVSFIPITVIGAWYFVRLGLHLSDVERSEQAPHG
jgi:uncharacterized protein (TIRG00374 family)